jgi:hypothetical protein
LIGQLIGEARYRDDLAILGRNSAIGASGAEQSTATIARKMNAAINEARFVNIVIAYRKVVR